MNKTIVLTKNGMTIIVKVEHGIITNIENKRNTSFPFHVGEYYHRNVETWARMHDWLWDGKNLHDDDKIYGIRKKDIPEGHSLKYLK